MKMTDVVGLIDEKAAEVAIVRRVYKERDAKLQSGHRTSRCCFAFLLNRGPRPDAHEKNCRHRLPLGASQLTAVKAIVQFDLYGRYLVMPCLGKWSAPI
jgi:hypothetical protein